MVHMRAQSLPGTPAASICRRCRRVLKNEASVQAGIGPVCAAKESAEIERRNNPKPISIDPFDPETMDITMRRHGNGHDPVFNIEQRHRHHSPSGMEFAYGGSGPADLALNILALFLPVQGEPVTEWHDDGRAPNATKLWDGSVVSWKAYALHQRFKRDFIENANFYGTTIKGVDIKLWIIQQETVDEND